MGLFVVGRLADRHGIRVQLRPSGEQAGTTSLVMLPEPITHGGGGEDSAGGRSSRSRGSCPSTGPQPGRCGPRPSASAPPPNSASTTRATSSGGAASLDPVGRSLGERSRRATLEAAARTPEAPARSGATPPGRRRRTARAGTGSYAPAQPQRPYAPGQPSAGGPQYGSWTTTGSGRPATRSPRATTAQDGYQQPRGRRRQPYEPAAVPAACCGARRRPPDGQPGYGSPPSSAPGRVLRPVQALRRSRRRSARLPAERIRFTAPPEQDRPSTEAGLRRRSRRAAAANGSAATPGPSRQLGQSRPSRPQSRHRRRTGTDWRSHERRTLAPGRTVREPQAGGVTPSGLPRRVPRANLVAGAAEQTPQGGPSVSRAPEDVRGRLSNLHRGVRRGAQRATPTRSDRQGFGPGSTYDQER